MTTSILNDKLMTPNDELLSIVMNDKMPLWEKINNHVIENYRDITSEWKYPNKKSGWCLIFKRKDKTAFYFIPCEDYFKLIIVYSDKALNIVKHTALPKHIMDMVDNAISCATGHSCYINVVTEDDVEPVLSLLKVKMES